MKKLENMTTMPMLIVSMGITLLIIMGVTVDATLNFKRQSTQNHIELTLQMKSAMTERQQIQDDITKMETHLLELMETVNVYELDTRNFD